MDIQDLIKRLAECTGSDRQLDGQIAMVLGFRKRIEPFIDEKGQTRNRTIWLVPTGDDVARIPNYTSNLEDAYQLANAITNNKTGGVSWVDGNGTATINDGEYCQAATPSLALCIAALRAKT